MLKPKFDGNGVDRETFAPFELENMLDSEWKDVRLLFDDWDWMVQTYGEYFNGYYLNGYGVEGLVKACRLHAGLEVEPELDLELEKWPIHYNSEGSTCYIHFADLEDAVETATLAAEMLNDPAKMAAMVQLAKEHSLDD